MPFRQILKLSRVSISFSWPRKLIAQSVISQLRLNMPKKVSPPPVMQAVKAVCPHFPPGIGSLLQKFIGHSYSQNKLIGSSIVNLPYPDRKSTRLNSSH